MDEKEIKELVEKLSDTDWAVRGSAADDLGNAATNKKTKELVLNLLVEKLSDKNPVVRPGAARALRNAARNGVDISLAIPALEKELYSKNRLIKEYAAEALGNTTMNAAVNEKTKERVLNLLIGKLSDRDWDVRKNVAYAWGNAAEKGVDISAAVPKLVKLLSDEYTGVRWGATYALANAARNCKTRKEVIAILKTLHLHSAIRSGLREIYKEWMEKQNGGVELKIDKKMRKPKEKPDRNSLKKIGVKHHG